MSELPKLRRSGPDHWMWELVPEDYSGPLRSCLFCSRLVMPHEMWEVTTPGGWSYWYCSPACLSEAKPTWESVADMPETEGDGD